MKRIFTFITAIAALISATALVSCDKTQNLEGSWTSAPQQLHNVGGAFTASTIDVLNFTNADDSHKNGTILISSMISAQQTVSGIPDLIEPYQETVAATATISGTWAYRDGEDDDIDMVLDFGSLEVKVDPSGVAFSQNFITGREQPQLDSLTASTAARWQQSIYQAVKPYYGKYMRFDDVKIHNGIMHAEVNDTDLTFTRETASK